MSLTPQTDAPSLRDAPWLTSGPAARVLGLLNRDGEEARVVGGAVRNALMNLPETEIDIATTAPPDAVVARARAASIKTIATGIEHGTVTLVIAGRPIEVTTLRQDVETYGRKAKVAFGRDWVRDAERRDFTINALSVTADGAVHDFVGGVADIAARRVRFIGEPAQRIAEDYLRILRFFRIHAAFGSGEPDRAALLACLAGRDGLDLLSAERIRMEMLKLLVAPGAAAALQAMGDGGLLLRILGGVTYHSALAAMIEIERVMGLEADAIRRLAALAVALPEDARRLAQRLRLSNAEAKRLDAMGHRWWRLKDMEEDTARRRLYRLGVNVYVERLLLAWARAGAAADAERFRRLASLPQRWCAPEFRLKAADFIARGVPEGPLLGQALTLAEDAWLAADFPDGAGALMVIADESVARLRRDGRL